MNSKNTTDKLPSPAGKGPNYVLWLVIAIPALTVVAGLGTLGLCIARADRELPARFHWEGSGWDKDLRSAAMASQLGIRAHVVFDTATQQCRVTLNGPPSDTLRLEITHPIEPSADRHVVLQKHGDDYSAACPTLQAAHWYLELADDRTGWTVRGRLEGAERQVELDARPSRTSSS
jgi:hypothetical protein